MISFKSFILFPGDITGVLIPALLHELFNSMTGIEKPHPFTLYLTNEGHLLVGRTKDGLNKPLIILDNLIESFEINRRLGILGQVG